MPINWKLPTTYQKLLAAVYAASPQTHNYASIAAIFGEGATYDSIEGRFRIIKRDAAKLKTEAEAEGRLTATATAAMRPRSAKKGRGAGENVDEGAGAGADANAENGASGGDESREGQGSTGSGRTPGPSASASTAKKQGGIQAVLSGRVVKNKAVKRDDGKGKGKQIERTLEGSARMPVVLDGEASDDEIFGEKDDRVMGAGSGKVGSSAYGSARVVEPAVTINSWGEHAKRTRLSDIGDSSMDVDAHGEEVDELDLTTEIAMGILKSEEIRSAQVKGELMGF